MLMSSPAREFAAGNKNHPRRGRRGRRDAKQTKREDSKTNRICLKAHQ